MNQLFLTSVLTAISSIAFVISLHIDSPSGDRDDPRIVQWRIRRCLLFTLVDIIVTIISLRWVICSVKSFSECFEVLGMKLHWSTSVDILRIVMLFSWLFMGPIIDEFIGQYLAYTLHRYPANPEPSFVRYIDEPPIYAVRDLVVAPVTEETVFSALAVGAFVPLLSANSRGMNNVATLTPLLFGTAHIHHGYEMWKRGQPTMEILASVLFQFLYTTMFGTLTDWIFINSHSVYCCIAAHAFCNYFGFPALQAEGGKLRRYIYWGLLGVGVWMFRTFFNDMTKGIDE